MFASMRVCLPVCLSLGLSVCLSLSLSFSLSLSLPPPPSPLSVSLFRNECKVIKLGHLVTPPPPLAPPPPPPPPHQLGRSDRSCVLLSTGVIQMIQALVFYWLLCHALKSMRSVLGLVGPVLVYQGREQV